MTTYRQARPDERNDYIDLANYTFGFDIEALLPKVYDSSFDSASITKVAENSDGKLIAEVAVLPQTVHAGGLELRTNFLGIMVVHPRFRSQGHMKAIMNSCLEEMPGKYHMSVLDGKRQRYEYFGYTSGGVQYEYKVIKDNIRHALKAVDSGNLQFSPLSKVDGWKEFLINLLTSREVYVERNPEQMSQILSCYHQHAFGILENGTLIGYLLTDQDRSYVSEFCLLNSADTKKTIKAYFSAFDLQTVIFTLPEYEKALNKELSDFAECYHISPLNMYNIFDFAAVLEAFLTVKHHTYGLSHGTFSAVMDSQPVTITVSESGVLVEKKASEDAVTLDKMDAQKLILTPYGRYMDINVPKDWFPLPLFWNTVDCF